MIDEPTIRQFFRRLNHKPFGLTELVAIDKGGKGIRATGFYTDEDAFLTACGTLNGSNNLYAGRNPRPFSFSSSRNKMDSVHRLRASEVHIKTLTAISLDIDPIRPKDQPANRQQREVALRFASLLQRFLGGYVDDSGNGAYLWIPFCNSIQLFPIYAGQIKAQCRQWQQQIVDSFAPVEHGLRIDGCFDFSRIKRVMGTYNHKAQRLSSLHLAGDPSDSVRNEILSLPILYPEKKEETRSAQFSDLPKELSPRFLQLLKKDSQLQERWETPDPFGDRSAHDWALGRYCVEKEIVEPRELAVILMKSFFGKYHRDGRREYVMRTVGKLTSLVS
jgi:hypothetical protein